MESGTPPAPDSARAAGREYEFDETQNKTIAGLANEIRWVAAPLFIVGLLYLIVTVASLVQHIREPGMVGAALFLGLVTLFFLALGGWLRKSAKAFASAANTQGNDIRNLMTGLEHLRKTFSLLSFFVKLYVILILVALIATAAAAIIGRG